MARNDGSRQVDLLHQFRVSQLQNSMQWTISQFKLIVSSHRVLLDCYINVCGGTEATPPTLIASAAPSQQHPQRYNLLLYLILSEVLFLAFSKIFRLTIPVFMGYIPLGIAFGLLAVKVGIEWYYACLMSIFIYAGSAQFLCALLFSEIASLVEIFAAIFLLNLRHFFYGLSMINEFRHMKGFAKKYSIFALTDETFALLKSLELGKEEKEKAFVGVAFLNQTYWIAGSFIGSFGGDLLPFDFKGIEFALSALFVVLSIELYQRSKAKTALFLSLAVGFFALLCLPPSHMLILSLLICSFCLIGLKGRM
jgi:4-azaleucine resistance transporter AzlC